MLGLQLLQELFAVHAEARGEVLKVVQVREAGLMYAAMPCSRDSKTMLGYSTVLAWHHAVQ